jgi:hypothetical protein
MIIDTDGMEGTANKVKRRVVTREEPQEPHLRRAWFKSRAFERHCHAWRSLDIFCFERDE